MKLIAQILSTFVCFLLLLEITAFAESGGSLRVSLGSGTGEAAWKDSGSLSALSGELDHDLSGSSLAVSYVHVRDNNLIVGGGYQSVSVSGSSGVNSDYVYIYQGTTYPMSIKLEADQFLATFLYGLVGYYVTMSEKWSFQPNVKIGSKSATLTATATVELTDPSTNQKSTGSSTQSYEASGTGFEIDLPFVYKFEAIGLGVSINLGGTAAEFVDGTETTSVTSFNSLNLFMDFYF